MALSWPSARRVAVPQGIGAAALSHAHVVGRPAASARERVSFILSAQHLAQLQALVSAGGSSRLSVSQFASQFGRTNANITALSSYLHRFGITTHALADRLVISSTGTVADYNKALGIKQSTFQSPATPAIAGRPARPAFRNPAIYKLAAGPGSPFTPLDQTGTGDDNLFYTGTRNNLFNPSTGLGMPNFTKLAARFD